MGEQPLVSVIIPTYNCAAYLKEAIVSVCCQTYLDIEIIVVDDGSTDETPEVVRGIQDRRVTYLWTENRGNYYARNVGLAQAQGEYIAFLDADDVWVKNKLEKQIHMFKENPALGLCCSSIFERYTGDKHFYGNPTYTYGYSFDSASGFVRRLIDRNFILTSSLVIRRECMDKLGVFETAFQNAMDYEYCLRIAVHYFSAYMSDRLVVRRLHATNISKNKIITYKSLLYTLGECLPRFKKGTYYRPEYDLLVERRLEEVKYYLGLAFLKEGKYDEASQLLKVTKYSKNPFFLWIARLAAICRWKVLSVMIEAYRQFKLDRSRVRLRQGLES